jgi:hypothetical protein
MPQSERDRGDRGTGSLKKTSDPGRCTASPGEDADLSIGMERWGLVVDATSTAVRQRTIVVSK